ncbi:MAG: dihydrofolate reductase family protein [Deltaproteobacteria bacterium]|nr:dihydrofolate reductase family protein [Deltaproteobacteria bacterium]
MKIISNTAITLDGRISPERTRHRRFGSQTDVRMMSVIRKKADAVLLGGNSFRHWPYPVTSSKKTIYNVVVTARFDLPVTREFRTDKRIIPLILTTKKRIPKNFPLEVLQCRGRITPAWIVRQLAARGVKTLLLEGGGDLIHQFVRDGFLNRMYVTLCPKLIGRKGAPTLCDGAGFKNPEIKGLSLVRTLRCGDEIFLEYDLPGTKQR